MLAFPETNFSDLKTALHGMAETCLGGAMHPLNGPLAEIDRDMFCYGETGLEGLPNLR